MAAFAAAGLCFVSGCSVEGCGYNCPDPPPTQPVPTVEPAFIVVQVGATAVLSALSPGIDDAAYQWRRTSRQGITVDIAGATRAAYTLSGAQLPDDGTLYSVRVQGVFNGSPIDLESMPARLAVSSMPGVVFQDGEFRPSDWAAASLSSPPGGGSMHVEDQAMTGGNPGAYRTQAIVLPTGPGKLSLFDEFQPATYDPASHGPIYLIEFAIDCRLLPGAVVGEPALLIEQDGRRFVAAGAPAQCGSPSWSPVVLPLIFSADAFVQVQGPGCAAGESCPDLGGGGKPIRFGFASRFEALVGSAAGSDGLGFDNWKVTVWRR